MSFRKGTFATAGACIAIALLVYAEVFHHEALWNAVVFGATFCMFCIICLAIAAFALITVGSVILSIWFALEWCWRKLVREGGRT